MGLILTIFILCIIVSGIAAAVDDLHFFAYWRGGIILGFALTIAAIVIFTIMSYSHYLQIRTFYTATKEQYRSAITLLNQNVLEVPYSSSQALTDFTGKEYTKEVSSKIDDFKKQVIRYNRNFIRKKVMGRNWFFKGLVIQPDDDMKIIRLIPVKK